MKMKEVFVTYSWDSEEHNNIVLSFVNHLRNKGFEAECDRLVSQQQTAIDFKIMMHNAMTKYKKVIVVLSKGYKTKANNFKGGVGTEYAMILSDIEKNPRKYVLVSFEEISDNIKPLVFMNREIVVLNNEDNWNNLFAKLMNKDLVAFSPVASQKPTIVTQKIPLFENQTRKKEHFAPSYHGIKKDTTKELNNIPTRNPETLIGRTTFLTDLRKQLEENKRIVLVNAMGGIGKTSVAEAYTFRYYKEYKKIVWLQQSFNQDIRLAFTNDNMLLDSLNIKREKKELETLFAEVCNGLNKINDEPKLFVIDNANQVEETIYPFWKDLPKQPKWHVLFTSRQKITDILDMELDFLSDQDAIDLFKHYYGKDKPIDEAQLLELIQQFEKHTLTIEILAKAMQNSRYTFTELKEALNKDIPVHARTDHSNKAKIERIKTYLSQIFDMSNLSDQEINILKQFACLPDTPHTFTMLVDLLVEETNEENEQKTITKQELSILCNGLYKKGWLLYNDKEESYKMHAIIKELVPDKYPILEEDVVVLLKRITEKLSIDQTKDNPIHKFPWIPFGQSIEQQLKDNTPQKGKLQNNLALVLQDLGDYEGAKDLLEKAKESAESNFGASHPNTAVSYSNLGLVLKDLGDYERAKILLKKAVLSNESSFDENDKRTMVSYSNLAAVYWYLKDYERARKLLEKVVRSDKLNFGENHPNTAVSYSNLGLVLKDLGDYEEAKLLLEKALRSNELNFGENHVNTAVGYLNLGMVHKDLADSKEAKDLLKKAVLSNESNLGESHPTTAVSYLGLASVYSDLDKYTLAYVYAVKAYNVFVKTLPPKHPQVKDAEFLLNSIKQKST